MVGERERWKEGEIGRAGQTFPQRLAELRSELDQQLAEAKQKHATALAAGDGKPRPARSRRIRNEYDIACRELRAEHDRDWESLAERWRTGLAEIERSLGQIARRVRAAVSRIGTRRNTTRGQRRRSRRRQFSSAT